MLALLLLQLVQHSQDALPHVQQAEEVGGEA